MAQSLLSAVSVTMGSRVLRFVLGLTAASLIARQLGPEGQGMYAVAMLLPSLAVAFSNLGIGRASTFFLSKGAYPASSVLGSVIAYAMVLGLISCLACTALVAVAGEQLFPGVPAPFLLLALSLVPLQLVLGFGHSVLVGLQRFNWYNGVVLLEGAGLPVFAVVLLWALRLGVPGAIGATALATGLSCAVLLNLAVRATRGFHCALDLRYARECLRYGLLSYVSDILALLHYRIDMLLVNLFCGAASAGSYSIANVLAEKVWFISQSVGLVLFPRVASERDGERLIHVTQVVCRGVLCVTAVVSGVLAVAGQWMISFLFSGRFSDSVAVLRILLMGAVAISGWRILAVDLYGRGKLAINCGITGVSVVLNVALNLLWIPEHGILGAAWATVTSYSVAFMTAAVVHARLSGGHVWDVIVPKKTDWRYVQALLSTRHSFRRRRPG